MELYNKLKQPPKDALKAIAAGRLKGKTDISPQWRIEAMTEHFGICGIGWKYVITKQWSEVGANDQIFAFTNIDLYIKQDGVWSDAIPGTGGSMLVTKEQGGLHSSDEGYKMSLTDALSVSMKSLGMAADIYRGFFDGSKYNNETNDNIQPNQNNSSSTVNSELPWLNRFAKDGVTVLNNYINIIHEAKKKGLTPKDLSKYYRISKNVASYLENDFNKL